MEDYFRDYEKIKSTYTHNSNFINANKNGHFENIQPMNNQNDNLDIIDNNDSQKLNIYENEKLQNLNIIEDENNLNLEDDIIHSNNEKRGSNFEPPIFSILNFNLYEDDLIILCLLFVLYLQGNDDITLYIILILLLLS